MLSIDKYPDTIKLTMFLEKPQQDQSSFVKRERYTTLLETMFTIQNFKY